MDETELLGYSLSRSVNKLLDDVSAIVVPPALQTKKVKADGWVDAEVSTTLDSGGDNGPIQGSLFHDRLTTTVVAIPADITSNSTWTGLQTTFDFGPGIGISGSTKTSHYSNGNVLFYATVTNVGPPAARTPFGVVCPAPAADIVRNGTATSDELRENRSAILGGNLILYCNVRLNTNVEVVKQTIFQRIRCVPKLHVDIILIQINIQF
ncbi:hypothetical protein B0T25DRAFT_565534 [Lasiosphaeria hispida]|uniref:Uncharacterized protein n=1 Tax=Lasiosphaeria hispida TaxID=260671 RepID=A0AAJ0MJ34_9PEZI|nr:hypothetical protein B0T25DRAFT_565534 [Lasiosphaeria hispida]